MSEVQNNEGCTKSPARDVHMRIPAAARRTDFREPANKYSNIKKVIGVVSGKEE